MQGFLGQAWYRGPDMRPLLPALWLGQWLHIGKWCVLFPRSWLAPYLCVHVSQPQKALTVQADTSHQSNVSKVNTWVAVTKSSTRTYSSAAWAPAPRTP